MVEGLTSQVEALFALREHQTIFIIFVWCKNYFADWFSDSYGS